MKTPIRGAGRATPEKAADAVNAEVERLIADGRPADAVRLLRERGGSAEPSPDRRFALARALLALGRDSEAIIELDAVAGTADRLSAARAGALLAGLRVVTGTGDDNLARARAAIVEGIRLEDGSAIVSATLALATAHYYRGEIVEAVAATERAITWAELTGTTDPPLSQVLVIAGVNAMHADRFELAAELFQRAVAEAPTVASQNEARLHAGLLDFHAGRWDDAAPVIRRALEAALPDWAAGGAVGLLAQIYIQRDQLDTAVAILAVRPAVAAPAPRLFQLWATALLAEARGDTALAATLAERLVVVTRDMGSPIRLRLYGPDLVRVLLAEGDVGLASSVCDELDTVARASDVGSVMAAALLARGLLSRDARLLAAAADGFAASPRRFEAAAARLALAHQQRADDDLAAIATYGRALEALAELGAWRKVREADRALRTLGVRPGRRGVRARPVTGWASLTPTEAHVAALVSAGLSNAGIAAEMAISPRTVESHVASLLRKLGARSRTGVAVAAASAARATMSGPGAG